MKKLFSGLSPFIILFQQRFLILQLVKRDIVGRTSGTVMGGIWLIAQPALQVMAFWFLLDFVFRVRSPGRITFLDYFLIGMLPWLFFSEVLNRSLNVLSEFGALYQRSRFPVSVLPLLPLVLNLVIYLPIYLIVAIYFQGMIAGLKAVAVLLTLFVWAVPFVYLLAVIGLFIRETRQVFPFFLTMVLYVTPILYAPDMLPESVRWAMAFNPMADVIALIQGVLHDFDMERGNWLRPLILWMILLTPSWILFKRTEPHMREVL